MKHSCAHCEPIRQQLRDLCEKHGVDALPVWGRNKEIDIDLLPDDQLPHRRQVDERLHVRLPRPDHLWEISEGVTG